MRRSAAAPPERRAERHPRRQPGRPPEPRAAAGRAEAGFTLVELLVVLVLIAAVMGLAMPRFAAAPPGTLARRAEAVAADLARLRLEAMGAGEARTASSAALAAALPEPFALTTAEPAEIVFYPNGTSNGAVWQLAAGSEAITIDVDWLTGRVSLDAP